MRRTIGATLTLTTLLTGHAVAQKSLDCAYFPKPNLIMVGGREYNTPVIPVVLDYITLDLTLEESCHAVTWGIATEEGGDREKEPLRKKFCFNIDPNGEDVKQEIKATFKNIPENGRWAGVTETVVKISAWEDRATALALAGECQMRPKRQSDELTSFDGEDIKYREKVPRRDVAQPAAT
jgi:hypothetical protein